MGEEKKMEIRIYEHPENISGSCNSIIFEGKTYSLNGLSFRNQNVFHTVIGVEVQTAKIPLYDIYSYNKNLGNFTLVGCLRKKDDSDKNGKMEVRNDLYPHWYNIEIVHSGDDGKWFLLSHHWEGSKFFRILYELPGEIAPECVSRYSNPQTLDKVLGCGDYAVAR